MHEALFWKAEGESVRCLLCPHHCLIAEGGRGRCGVRENHGGKLIAMTYALPCSLAVDPVEKKPLYHVMPGETIFSLATVGCNLECKWCQNSELSHPEGKEIIAPYGEVSPEKVIELCKETGCRMIACTYTEPTVFYEYMLDIFTLAKKEGILTVMVSNGFIEEEPLEKLIPFLDAANIDLKCFDDAVHKRWTLAPLPPVLSTIKRLKKAGVWVELTTLVVPGVNDDESQLEALFSWIETTLGKEQVIHLSRFHPSYKTTDKAPTTMATLQKAAAIGRKHLDYIYVGNILPTGETHDTRCPGCDEILVKRGHHAVKIMMKGRTCPSCDKDILGIWTTEEIAHKSLPAHINSRRKPSGKMTASHKKD
jgi:pyruvate formate lyase activating enzyme